MHFAHVAAKRHENAWKLQRGEGSAVYSTAPCVQLDVEALSPHPPHPDTFLSLRRRSPQIPGTQYSGTGHRNDEASTVQHNT